MNQNTVTRWNSYNQLPIQWAKPGCLFLLYPDRQANRNTKDSFNQVMDKPVTIISLGLFWLTTSNFYNQ